MTRLRYKVNGGKTSCRRPLCAGVAQDPAIKPGSVHIVVVDVVVSTVCPIPAPYSSEQLERDFGLRRIIIHVVIRRAGAMLGLNVAPLGCKSSVK